MSNLERKITFYLKDDKKVSTCTNKTNEELAEILEKYNYIINIDNKGVLFCINLKQVIYLEIK